jgi:hypothetical protein
MSTLLQNVSIWINQGSILKLLAENFSHIVFEDRSNNSPLSPRFLVDPVEKSTIIAFIFPNNAQDTFYVLWNGGVSI